MRNYQIYPYSLRDGVVLHDTGVGTVPNKQNFASTAKRWVELEVQSKDTWQELRRNGLCCVTIYCVKVILFYIAPVQCSVCVLWTVQWKESRYTK